MMRYYLSAGIVLYRIKNNEAEYLLLHYLSGHWDFPKGKVEPGESRHEAALRELKEETNLHASLDDTFQAMTDYDFTDYDGKRAHKTVVYFLGQLEGNDQIILSDEHLGSIWLAYSEAIKKITFEKEVLAKADEWLGKTAKSKD